MNTDKMKRFARDLRRHADVPGMKLSHAQNATARIHGRRDWHHLEQEGPDAGMDLGGRREALLAELLAAGSAADVHRVQAALLPDPADATFAPLREGERNAMAFWQPATHFHSHRRHEEYRNRLKALPAGGMMVLAGDWAMDVDRSNQQACREEGLRQIRASLIGDPTPSSLAYVIRHDVTQRLGQIKDTPKAVAAAIEAIGDGNRTVISLENVERKLVRKGVRIRDTIGTLAAIVQATGARAVVLIDDEHVDRDAAVRATLEMATEAGMPVEVFDYAPYPAGDPEFGRLVNAVAAELPMPADPVEGEDLAAFHALTRGLIGHIDGCFMRLLDYSARDGKRVTRLNHRALAVMADTMREHFGSYVALDLNPFTGEPWNEGDQERWRRENEEQVTRLKAQGDPLAGYEGLERAVRYERMSDQGLREGLIMAANRGASPITIAEILDKPVSGTEGHYSEGERWWTVVSGVAFKLRISAKDDGRWRLDIGTPGMKSRYDDGAFHFDRAAWSGHVSVDGDTPFEDHAQRPVRFMGAKDVVGRIRDHVVAATDPALATITPERRRALRSVLRAAALASGSVSSSYTLALGHDLPGLSLGAARGAAWREARRTAEQEIRLAFPDAIGRTTYAGSIQADWLNHRNPEGRRVDASTATRPLARLGLPTALVDAIEELASADLVPDPQTMDRAMAT